jgi:hypothetical protein
MTTSKREQKPAWLQKQMRDRAARLAQIRAAGEKSRRRDRQRKAMIEALSSAILTGGQPSLRKIKKREG